MSSSSECWVSDEVSVGVRSVSDCPNEVWSMMCRTVVRRDDVVRNGLLLILGVSFVILKTLVLWECYWGEVRRGRALRVGYAFAEVCYWFVAKIYSYDWSSSSVCGLK